MVSGSWSVEMNSGPDLAGREVAEGSVVSVPPGTWRNFVNTGSSTAECMIVCGGDQRSRIEWSPDIVEAAQSVGWMADASGYLAPVALTGGPS